jgi:hypothetical protein
MLIRRLTEDRTRIASGSGCRGLRPEVLKEAAAMSEFYDTVRSYLTIYKASVVWAWNHMTPQQYASVLMFVAFVGWLSMRGKSR